MKIIKNIELNNILEKIEGILEFGGTKKDILFLIISAITLIFSLIDIKIFGIESSWIAIILCGFPIIMGAAIGLIKDFDVKADLLVSLALIAAVFIGEFFAAGEVAFIMQLGALLEEITVKKARSNIEKLVDLNPKKARILRENEEFIVEVEEIKIGDILKILPGESIAVDGIITKGESSIDESVMTGEAIPLDKTVGDEVLSGTTNQFGAFEMVATKVGKDSSIQKMISLVEAAEADKAKIVGIADKWATWIVVIALLTSIITWYATGEIIRAVTILVVFCPCSLVLATPTAIIAAIGNVTKYGFLIKEGDALERLAKVKKISFDKTGTLTYGKAEVIDLILLNEEYTKNEVFRMAASLENYSEHPLGKAIVNSYKKSNNEKLYDITEFSVFLGKGVKGKLAKIENRGVNKNILIGNLKFLNDNNIFVSQDLENKLEKYKKDGSAIIYFAIDNKINSCFVLADTIKEKAKELIDNLKNLDIKSVLLSGDNYSVARKTARLVGIEEVCAECLPEDKLNYISTQNEEICMVGDGINDAPALKKAYVSIAMGGIGNDIAIDAADIILTNDNISSLTHLVALSKKMMSTIKINLSFSMILNFVAIYLAIVGLLNPIMGALVHNAGSILVIVNSILLLNWKTKKYGSFFKDREYKILREDKISYLKQEKKGEKAY